jgi:hypothetical protein
MPLREGDLLVSLAGAAAETRARINGEGHGDEHGQPDA